MKAISSIELFIRVVQLGSLSAAAREADVMPSSVSRQMLNLEEELNAKLFQRTTRKQSLTEAGVLFYDYALRLSQALSEAKDAMNRLSASPTGTLHVAMEADFSKEFVAPLLPEFLRLYPDIKFRANLSANMLNLVEEGVDLAVRMGHLTDSSLVSKKLATSHSVICCSQQYLANKGTPSIPQDLAQHDCLSFKINSGSTVWKFERAKKPSEVVINSHIRVNSLGFLKQMALADQGIVMMPVWMVQQELATKKLVTVLDDYQLTPASTPIQAVFPSKAMLAPKVRAFIDFLSDKLPG